MKKQNHTLFDEVSHKGVWWIPQEPDKKVSGILHFKPGEEITLNLIGSFYEIESFGNKTEEIPIILGISDTGKYITLYKNYKIASSISSLNVITSIYRIKYVFLGKHFSSPDSLKFSELLVNYTNLEEWMDVRPFTRDFGEEKHTLSYLFPDILEVNIPFLSIKIESDFSYVSSGDGYRTMQIEQTAFIKIIPQEEKDFDWFYKMLFNIRNLLTILIGEPTYPKIIIALSDIIILNNEKKTKERIEILYRQLDQSHKERILPFDMYILLPHIHKNIEKIFNLWFEKSSELKSVCDLFFGTFYNPSMYLEFHFLSLMQALESYHRLIKGGKYMSDEEYSKCKEELLKSIPIYIKSDHRDSLKAKIGYGNEYSLRKRLKDIFNSFSKSTTDSLSIEPDKFIKKVIDTRNFLTHYDDKLKNKALKDGELYSYNYKLKLIITILILIEIGINEIDIIKALEQNRKFIQLVKKTYN